MTGEVTFYVELGGDDSDAAGTAARLAESVRALQGVGGVDARMEDAERGVPETIESITLTVTALGGTVMATNALVAQVQELLAKLKPRAAHVETAEGVRQLPVGTPMNENPAQ